MTTIRTTCSICGDVELMPGDLSLELQAVSGSGSYRFECPFCAEEQRRPANHRVVSILLATGVTYQVVEPEGEPITEGEIHRFSKALDSADWSQELNC